eukprot:1152054-Pelagomonas_calceolata.AAC.6
MTLNLDARASYNDRITGHLGKAILPASNPYTLLIPSFSRARSCGAVVGTHGTPALRYPAPYPAHRIFMAHSWPPSSAPPCTMLHPAPCEAAALFFPLPSTP